MNLLANKMFNTFCRFEDIQNDFQNAECPLIYDWQKSFSNSGILIWHILEDRIFISEGFCRLMGISKKGIFNLEFIFMTDPACEFKSYLRNILDQVCSNKIADTNFKTKIPGIEKEINGTVQLFDLESKAIMDLVLICWEL